MRIPPSESRTQQTFAGHKWRCRSRPDGTLLVTVACGDADLFVTDLSPELGEPRRLELDNHTQTEAEAVWLDGESGAETSYLRAPPGESCRLGARRPRGVSGFTSAQPSFFLRVTMTSLLDLSTSIKLIEIDGNPHNCLIVCKKTIILDVRRSTFD